MELSTLGTEGRNLATAEIDILPPAELVSVLHAESHKVAAAVDAALGEIARVVEETAARLRFGGRLIYVGAGTSGRLGVLDASECPPTFGVPKEMVQGIIAGGDGALRNSIEGAEDDEDEGRKVISDLNVTGDDVVIGIAASGRTPFVIGAIKAAREAGAFTAAIVNVHGSALARETEVAIVADTGPEPVTGSTRMKAGTAQKMVLNLISTGAMVLLGKTSGNLMVDVQATNEKLRDRAERIVMEVAHVERPAAARALAQCSGSAKLAIASLILDISPEAARETLMRCGGRLRAALEHRP